jgi:phytoene synthase
LQRRGCNIAYAVEVSVSELAKGYRLCRRFAREVGSNFHYCFYLLPRAKRQAMWALYAFLRRVDDIGDKPSLGHCSIDARRHELTRLRASLDRALAGRFDDPQFAALADVVTRYRIPPNSLYATMEGVAMDLAGHSYETFAELSQYCHRVASVVGQACIHIWGFTDERALELAGDCGLAFQLTNILRDLREDAARGRIYLPAEDMRRFDYAAEDLRRGVVDDRYRALVRFEVARAEEYYRASQRLHAHLHADGRRIFYAMFHTYHRLLMKIARLDAGTLATRVRLAGWEKLHTAAEAILLPYSWRHPLARSGAQVS